MRRKYPLDHKGRCVIHLPFRAYGQEQWLLTCYNRGEVMNVYSLNDRILGCLIGAGAGDAMGAATESRTTEQILQYFGHKVTDFEVTPMDTFAKGNQPGQATDDFSSAYFITRHIIDHDGEITSEVVKEALIDWSEHPIFFDRFAGPTTRMAIRRL